MKNHDKANDAKNHFITLIITKNGSKITINITVLDDNMVLLKL